MVYFSLTLLKVYVLYIPLRFSSSSPKYRNIYIKTQVDLAVEAAGAVAVAGVMAVDQDMAGEVMALALTALHMDMALHMDLHTALDF